MPESRGSADNLNQEDEKTGRKVIGMGSGGHLQTVESRTLETLPDSGDQRSRGPMGVIICRRAAGRDAPLPRHDGGSVAPSIFNEHRGEQQSWRLEFFFSPRSDWGFSALPAARQMMGVPPAVPEGVARHFPPVV
jgi:hypothetical protein